MKKSCKELKRISRGALTPNWGIAILAYIVIQIIIALAVMPFEATLTTPYMYYLVDAYKELGIDLTPYIEVSPMPSMTAIIIAVAAYLIISLVSIVFAAGQYKLHLSLLRGEKGEIKQLFQEFKNRPDRYIVSNILISLIILAIAAVYVGIMAIATYVIIESNPIVSLVVILAAFVAYIFAILHFTFRFIPVTFLLVDHPEMKVMEAFKESGRLMKGNYFRYLYISFSFIPMELLVAFTFGLAAFFVNPYIFSVTSAFYMDITGEFQRNEEESRRLDEEMGPVLSE